MARAARSRMSQVFPALLALAFPAALQAQITVTPQFTPGTTPGSEIFTGTFNVSPSCQNVDTFTFVQLRNQSGGNLGMTSFVSATPAAPTSVTPGSNGGFLARFQPGIPDQEKVIVNLTIPMGTTQAVIAVGISLGNASCSNPSQSFTVPITATGPLPMVTNVIYFDGKWVGSDFTNDRLSYFDSRGNVLGTNPLGLGVTNLYGSAGKKYFGGVDSTGKYRGGYLYRDTTPVEMVFPTGFVPSGLAVHPDDTAVFIQKSPPSYVWFTKNYSYTSPVIPVPYQPSQIDVCPGDNWCIGGQTGLWVLDRNWSINPVPNSSANVTAVKFCGNTLALGGPGFLDYSLKPGLDYTAWEFTRVTLPFQVNSIDCGQNGTIVGAGTNGSVVYEDPTNNVTRIFQLSPTRNFIKVALGPGRSPNGYFLDSQRLLSYNLLASDLQSPADPNSVTPRLLQFSLRTLF